MGCNGRVVVARGADMPAWAPALDQEGTVTMVARERPGAVPQSGRVAQVNVSAGGVPKKPVDRAMVRRGGVGGDGHNEPPSIHGGPERAVCIYSIEKIRELRAEGHPIMPGSIGENLDLEGIDIGLLEPGDRLTIGDGGLVLEIASRVAPCRTIAESFVDGGYTRISPKLRTADARLYARVVAEGLVAPGDHVVVG